MRKELINLSQCTKFLKSLKCNKRYFNSKSLNNKLHPWFVTGFTDGDGCFLINTFIDKTFKFGWRVKLSFEINLHDKDRFLLEEIQDCFGVGNIYKQNSGDSTRYIVSSFKDLHIIRKHFDKYPLITKKLADFYLWTEALDLIQNQEHLTLQGFEKIMAIKASINRGLSDKLKAAFPHIIPVLRPSGSIAYLFDPYWLAGFVAAEGCFYVKINNSSSHRVGFKVILMFRLTQHARDEQLMRSLIKYFNCGSLYKNKEAFEYRIVNFSDIENKILPFFNKYPIIGVKSKDFVDWCKV